MVGNRSISGTIKLVKSNNNMRPPGADKSSLGFTASDFVEYIVLKKQKHPRTPVFRQVPGIIPITSHPKLRLITHFDELLISSTSNIDSIVIEHAEHVTN